jgi:hypothetical protein
MHFRWRHITPQRRAYKRLAMCAAPTASGRVLLDGVPAPGFAYRACQGADDIAYRPGTTSHWPVSEGPALFDRDRCRLRDGIFYVQHHRLGLVPGSAALNIDPNAIFEPSHCGFGREGLSRRIAFYKCVVLVEGTISCARSSACRKRACGPPTRNYGSRSGNQDSYGRPLVLARHARPCAGHPRLEMQTNSKAWMAGTSPAMTMWRVAATDRWYQRCSAGGRDESHHPSPTRTAVSSDPPSRTSDWIVSSASERNAAVTRAASS